MEYTTAPAPMLHRAAMDHYDTEKRLFLCVFVCDIFVSFVSSKVSMLEICLLYTSPSPRD